MKMRQHVISTHMIVAVCLRLACASMGTLFHCIVWIRGQFEVAITLVCSVWRDKVNRCTVYASFSV